MPNPLGITGLADKELFPCSHPEREEERESTTFWDDFSIADRYGAAAVEDTYRRAFGGWKSSYKYLTELVMVLNHKIWQHHGAGDGALAKLYDRLWREADAYGKEHLEGEEAAFFFAVLDQPGRRTGPPEPPGTPGRPFLPPKSPVSTRQGIFPGRNAPELA